MDLEWAGTEGDTLDGRLAVRVLGRVVRFEILGERRKKMKESQTGKLGLSGAGTIASPMPGKVIKHLVAVGDEVKEGDGVIVIEAMKMENELKAGIDGVVKEILIEEGKTAPCWW